MKKMMFLLSLISLNAFAYNTEYSPLVPGKQILVDVANKEVISLTLDTKNADGALQPKVEVINEWGNFECDHKQTLVTYSGFDTSTRLFKKTWEIQINWIPGADLSGCIVNVSFPGMKDSRAELFMNY